MWRFGDNDVFRCIPILPTNPDLPLGLLGSGFVLLGILAATFADILPVEKLTLANLLMDVGIMIGGTLGSYLTETIYDNFHMGFVYAGGLQFMVILYLLFFKKMLANLVRDQSLLIPRNSIYSITSENNTIEQNSNVGDLKAIWPCLVKRRPNNQHVTLWIYIAMYTLLSLAWSRGLLDDLYALNQPFCMNSHEIGLSNTIQSAVGIFSFSLLAFVEIAAPEKVPILVWLSVGAVSGFARIAVFIFSETVPEFYIQAALGGLFFDTISPFVRTAISSLVESHEHGTINSVYVALMNFSLIGGALAHIEIYKWAISFWRQLPMIIIDLPVSMIMISCIVWVRANKPKKMYVVHPAR